YARASMNGPSLIEIIRIINHSQRGLPPTTYFTIYGEPAPRRDGPARLPLECIQLSAARRNRQHSRNSDFLIYDKQHLPLQIDLDVRISCLEWRGPARNQHRLSVGRIKLTSLIPSFDSLKRQYCATRSLTISIA